MKALATFLAWTENRLEAIERSHLWAALRTFDDRTLSQAGFEPRLLDEGPEAWPWQSRSHGIEASSDMPIDQRAPVVIAAADLVVPVAVDDGTRHLDSDAQRKAA